MRWGTSFRVRPAPVRRAFDIPRRVGPPAAAPSLVALAGLLLAAGLGASPEIVERKGGAARKDWRGLSAGLKSARSERRPAVLWYAGTEAQGPRHFFEAYLKESRFRRQLDRFVLIRIDREDLPKPYPAVAAKDAPGNAGGEGEGLAKREAGKAVADDPPGAGRERGARATVAEKLRLLEKPAAVLVLDFRERVVRRYEARDKVPRRLELEKDLARLAARNALHAKRAGKVEKVLADSAAAFRKGDVRGAVRAVLPYDDFERRANLDAVLRLRVEKLLDGYREQARAKLEKAAGLVEEGTRRPADRAGFFTKAFRAYGKVAEEYPFQDVRERARKGRAALLTYLNPLGGVIGG